MDEQKYCSSCGEANSTDAAFCASCGKAFTSQLTSSSPASPPYMSQGSSGNQRYAPPPKPQGRFKKRYILYGIVVLFLLSVVGAAMSSSSSQQASTPTPTVQAPTAAPSATPTPAVTPTPTATPGPSSSVPKLTSDQISGFEAGIESDGYTVVQHLTYSGVNADGSLKYSGTLADANGTQYTYQLNVYGSAASAQAGYTTSVAALQSMGYSGSYSSSSSAPQWIGTTEESNGQVAGGTAILINTLGAPYVVCVAFVTV